MELIYTQHAKERMEEREITEEQIIETLEAPDDVEIGEKGEFKAKREYGNRTIVVAYEDIEEKVKVITVWNLKNKMRSRKD